MGLFGSEPVDFEAQIAEINASAERRRAILTQIAREKEAGARASAQLKALRSKKLASRKTVRKLVQVPSAPVVKRPIPSRLKAYCYFYFYTTKYTKKADRRTSANDQPDMRLPRTTPQAYRTRYPSAHPRHRPANRGTPRRLRRRQSPHRATRRSPTPSEPAAAPASRDPIYGRKCTCAFPDQ